MTKKANNGKIENVFGIDPFSLNEIYIIFSVSTLKPQYSMGFPHKHEEKRKKKRKIC